MRESTKALAYAELSAPSGLQSAPIKDEPAKPFLRWAGGKTRLINKILPYLPEKIGAYHEPFLGSGAVYFAIRSRIADTSYLSDLNDELINIWSIVQDDPERLLFALQAYRGRDSEIDYYVVRATSPTDPIGRAARFFYLNQTAWNGLWRVNRHGVFNVPWGARPFRGITAAALHAVSRSLERVEIGHLDFRSALARAEKGDLVYLDPPYLPVSDTSKFSGYTGKRFRRADLEELAEITRDLSSRGVRWVMSNRDTNDVRALFAHGEIVRFTTRRSVAAQNKRDVQPKDSPEVIVVGAPPMMRPVQAVFFWNLNFISVFRPIYGRLGNAGGYTKDFLQSPAGQWPSIDAALGRVDNAVPVEFRWPGGNQPAGVWRQSAADLRGQLAWPTNNPPSPWRVGDPFANPVVTVAGDPALQNAAAADAVHQVIVNSDVKPWLVAVKLADEGNILHLRVYLENPPAGLEDRGTATLPEALRNRITALPANQAGGALDVGSRAVPRAAALVARIQSALTRDPNVLLVGPPGTGKTVALEDLRALYEARILFDPDLWEHAWSEEAAGAGRKATSLVFHPSYTYENFVAGLVPAPAQSGGFQLQTQAGPLLSMAHWAGSPNREGLIIIDEFNRAPAAAVFGDTIALLDAEKRAGGGNAGAKIARPYPRETMNVPQEFAEANGNSVVPPQVSLPRSLAIVAAMNSTDRSVAPLDAALRRRFAIIEVPPDYEALAGHLGTQLPAPGAPFAPATPYTADDVKQLALRLLQTLNERIEQLLGGDFLLGQALLWQVSGADVEALGLALVRAFEERVLATLKLTFVDQDEALAALLNIPQPPANSPLGGWQQPAALLAGVAPPRLILKPLSRLGDWEQQLAALRTILDA